MKEFLKRICRSILESLGEGWKPTVDIASPRDLIPNKNVKYNDADETVTIKGVRSIWLTTVQDTNSMDPIIDYQHTAILTADFKVDDLQVGDVVVYWNGSQDIIHRIIRIEDDEDGRYFSLKGDNNFYEDFFRVRDSSIRFLLLGVVY